MKPLRRSMHRGRSSQSNLISVHHHFAPPARSDAVTEALVATATTEIVMSRQGGRCSWQGDGAPAPSACICSMAETYNWFDTHVQVHNPNHPSTNPPPRPKNEAIGPKQEIFAISGIYKHLNQINNYFTWLLTIDAPSQHLLLLLLLLPHVSAKLSLTRSLDTARPLSHLRQHLRM